MVIARALLLLFTFAISAPEARAQSCPGPLPADIECVAAGATKDIVSSHSPCVRVTNSHSTGKAIMIPAKTSTELSSFTSHLPSGVSTVSCVSGPTQILLSTAGTGSLSVPLSWNSSNNKIECVGAGGPGASYAPDGGQGGGYSRSNNVVLTPGTTIYYHIAPGTTSPDVALPTCVGSTPRDLHCNSAGTNYVVAAGGKAGDGSVDINSVAPTSNFIITQGGAGGSGNFGTGGGGGGGAANGLGDGHAGGTSTGTGGSGGGGHGGGTDGVGSTAGTGGKGGKNYALANGGGPGLDGLDGGGGGGGSVSSNGGNSRNSTDLHPSIGTSGGGGGSSFGDSSIGAQFSGGNGGPGGGGGGGTYEGDLPGSGGQGFCVLTYTP